MKITLLAQYQEANKTYDQQIDRLLEIIIDMYNHSDYRVDCAWCNKILRPSKSDKVSHGICKPCSLNAITDYRKGKES